MLKRKVSCTFKREKTSLDNQERIYRLSLRVSLGGIAVASKTKITSG